MSGAPSADRPSAPHGEATDPSMEDILASIRRILSEDGPPAESETPTVGAEPSALPAAAERRAPVLLLNEAMLVQEDEAPAPPEPTAAKPEAEHGIERFPHAEMAPTDPVAATDFEMAHPTPAHQAPDPFDDLEMPLHHPDPFDEPAASAFAPEPAVPAPHVVTPPTPPEAVQPEAAPPQAPAPAVQAYDPAHAAAPPMAAHAAAPLVAPEAAEATKSSVDSLMRQLAEERATQVYRGGPTVEDLMRQEIRPLLTQWVNINLAPVVAHMAGGMIGPMLREWLDVNLPSMTERMTPLEMRPLLKDWLDTNLPPMVEFLVRAELERLMARPR